MVRSVKLSEVTIRISERGLSFRKKIELSKQLDKLGVDVIEVGPILSGREDSLAVKSIASCLSNATLAVPVDIASEDSILQTWTALREAKKPRMQVCLPVSTVQMEYLCHKKPDAIKALAADLVSKCAALCPEVEFIALDFTRADKDFLRDILLAAVGAGAKVVCIGDKAGNLLYDEFQALVSFIRGILPDGVKLAVRCSNEMYMADACAVAAIRAGADEIKTSACDNSTVSLKRISEILAHKGDECGASCNVDVTAIKRAVSRMKALCEVHSQNHLSDIGGLEDDGEQTVLTMHDDKDSVLCEISRLGYNLSDEDAANVYDAFCRLSSRGDTIGIKELDAIVASVAFQAPATYVLESYVINSGNIMTATCHLRLRKGEEVLDSVCAGDGPVDAAFLAIEKLVDRQYELDDFQIRSVTEGREAMGEAVVRLRAGGKLCSGRGISTDIVGSSIMAYLNAINKIVSEEA